jgi:hypothetical protein
MSKLIRAPYRRCRDNHTKMLVGCIKMHLVSIKMLLHLCVGMFTLVTSLCVLRSKQVSIIPASDKYYCYQWCGRMRWMCVRDATGRDCNLVLALSSGRIVPSRAGSWEKYQHALTVWLIVCHV